MPWCGRPFRAQGVRPNKYILQMQKCDKNPAGTAAGELCPCSGLQPATPKYSATCKILSQGHPINQKIVLACHLQHSKSVFVSPNKVLRQYYSELQSARPVPVRTTKYYSSITLHNKVLRQYYSVLPSTTPVLPCTTKYHDSIVLYNKVLFQYQNVPQSITSPPF